MFEDEIFMILAISLTVSVLRCSSISYSLWVSHVVISAHLKNMKVIFHISLVLILSSLLLEMIKIGIIWVM